MNGHGIARCSCGAWATARKWTPADWGHDSPSGALTCAAHMGGSGVSWGRPLVTRAAWDATPADQRRRSSRGPAGETEHGSAVLTAHTPDEAPALLTIDPTTGGTVLVPVVIVEA